MAQTRNEVDKKVLSLVKQAGELLVNHKYDEVWPVIGQLNGLIKKKDDLTLPGYMVEVLEKYTRDYYHQNGIVTQAHKAMTAIGGKLSQVE